MKKKLKFSSQLMLTVKKAMGLVLPSCDETSRLISQALDESISPLQKLRIRMHLMFCKYCRSFMMQMAFIRSILKHQARDRKYAKPSEISLSDHARERIETSLKRKK
jgi:predicted anti-sigma-YlaC factor YlaD